MSGQSGSSLQTDEVLALKPCAHCKRTFAPKVLLKHEAICERSIKKRQIFNSADQRLEAVRSLRGASPPIMMRSPIAERPATSSQMPCATLASMLPPPVERNLAPLTAAAAAASTSRSAAAARSAPSSPKHSSRDAPARGRNVMDRCPFCDRTFGLRAIEAHVAYCMAGTQKALGTALGATPRNEETLNAKKRMETRMKYRPTKTMVKHPKH